MDGIRTNKNSTESLLDDRHNKPLKEGEVVKYTVTKRISPERAIVTIRGRQLLADISMDKSDKGVAKVLSIGKQLYLSIESKNGEETIQITSNNLPKNNASNTILLERGIKASVQNVNYLETVLKYMPDINAKHLNVVLSYISNGIYPTIDELFSIFDGSLFKIIREIFMRKNKKTDNLLNDVLGKKVNENEISVENLMLLSNQVANTSKLDFSMFETVVSNGHFAFWMMIFDILRQEEDGNLSENVRNLINVLSANRRSKFSKKNVYLIPLYIDIDGKECFVEMFLHDSKGRYEEHGGQSVMDMNVYDENNDVMCEIRVEKQGSFYKIIVYLSNEDLYLLYKNNEKTLLSELEKIDGIKIEVLACMTDT